MKEIRLTAMQIANMQHCARKGYFATSSTDSWDEIVKYGLATKRQDPFNERSAVFHLTQDGYEYLNKIQ